MENNELSIVLCGEAGQGIQTVEKMMTHILKSSGYNVFATKEYMSRVRGGANSTEIVVSQERVSSFRDRIDILMVLSKNSIKRLEKRIGPNTLIIGEKDNLTQHKNTIEIPFSKIATDIGSRLYSNSVALGVIFGMLRVDFKIVEIETRKYFSDKGERVGEKNVEALKKGYEFGADISKSEMMINIKKNESVKSETLLNGSEAIGFGALAGGCNFISSYPMSPSTGVLTFLAHQSKDFGIVVEQAEDEISAINMGIGAWYAGARAMVTTAGGGFALMEEGLSLSAMIESPMVIHVAQRPGPATGLPTRTEQGDLNLVLYAGHGEFPRLIYAPGNLEEAFYLTQKAFNMADKYQIPVFILTDQYFVDSYYNIPPFDTKKLKNEKYTIKTSRDYVRYRMTENGISPRGIPGFGEGLVWVDSDEHDEFGHITENFDVRQKMVEKRMKKLNAMTKENDEIEPVLVGSSNYKVLVLSWGSTHNVVKEAIKEIRDDEISALHFPQVYPLPHGTSNYLKQANKIVVVENNFTSQFGKLLKTELGVDPDKKILKYNGMPFSVGEIKNELKEMR